MAMDTKPKSRRTTTVPVTTMEELPVLDEAERAELVAALKRAGAEISAGDFNDYDAAALKQRLLRIYRGGPR